MSEFMNRYPGGFFICFNWAIDRISAAKLLDVISIAHNEGVTRIHLMLQSPGGLLADAWYVVEAMRSFPITYITYNLSTVQSAANLIYMLGDRRHASEGASFYFHQTGFEGVAGQRSSEREVREQLALIELGDRRSAELVAEHAGLSVEDVLAWQRAGHTLSAAEALAAGIVHAMGRPVIGPQAFVKQVVL